MKRACRADQCLHPPDGSVNFIDPFGKFLVGDAAHRQREVVCIFHDHADLRAEADYEVSEIIVHAGTKR